MPLLGGAAKMSQPVTSSNPNFTGDPYNITDIEVPPATARSELQLRADGTVWAMRARFADLQIGRWDNGLGTLTISDFDFRLDTISGGLDTGEPADTWVNGYNLMEWGVENNSGVSEFDGTIRVRDAGGGADHDTASVDLRAESTP